MWLNDEQLKSLTGRTYRSCQIRMLTEAGIPFRIVNRRPIVIESDLKSTVTENRRRVRKL